MDTITIYRVENEEGRGMYRGRNPVAMEKLFETKRHPTPSNDDRLKEVWNSPFFNFHFGFKSIEQLKYWIYKREWREELEEEGFFISQIKANGIHGDTQSIYDPESRRHVKRLLLSEV